MNVVYGQSLVDFDINTTFSLFVADFDVNAALTNIDIDAIEGVTDFLASLLTSLRSVLAIKEAREHNHLRKMMISQRPVKWLSATPLAFRWH
mgnify:CR=1 FL=1